LNLNGVATYVTDTAGIRETTGKVEQIGIQRAMDKAAEADLILYIEDISNPIAVDISEFQTDIWTIGNKVDLKTTSTPNYNYLISTKKNDGISTLLVNLSTY